MTTNSQPRKAQLDNQERSHLENVVTAMRERVERNVEYQLTEKYGLESRPDSTEGMDETGRSLVKAIDLEAADGDSWSVAFDQYLTGVGYTIVNRLAALRCMEVRGFIDEEVTRFRKDGLTPAADSLTGPPDFPLEDEALIQAYQNACDDLADEIEILFDRSTAYSLLDPDADAFEDLCEQLDEVPDEVWRADDVLGWVYEYYNVKLLDDLRRKGDREGLEPEDVPPANQFYTPHWVVRMLTDNSLGKLYLEDQGDLQAAVQRQESLTADERKNRPLSPDDSPDIADFCTYLVPSEEEGEAPDFDGPRDIRVIDPACGSGHFLLYAFDVLERIYRAETDLAPAEIPREILRNNLYGVDLDMRACQLAAFNLYLKGRTRAEVEGASGFDMPEIGIVCADAKVADIEGVEEVFEEVISSSSSIKSALSEDDVREALENILDAFEDTHGLGSLLDVRGTIGEMFSDEEGGLQLTFEDDFSADYTLSSFLHTLQGTISEHRDEDSFLAQDLRSFVRLLDVLAQDYDVALMNPPYGSDLRMPDSIQNYVENHYAYPAEFYINFFEVGERVTKNGGRIGMLVPRTFMFKSSFQQFREDFVGEFGGFDFLAEFGEGILDNAKVRTVGTVVRKGGSSSEFGDFIRLHDLSTEAKEEAFLKTVCNQEIDIDRIYQIVLSDFDQVPGSPLSYYTPEEVRDLHNTSAVLDATHAELDADSICFARQGLTTADDERFIRNHWETTSDSPFIPIAKGGPDAWVVPNVTESAAWTPRGRPIKRSPGSFRTRNEGLYGEQGLTWTYIKSTGRRFGFFPDDGLYSNTGFMLIPKSEKSFWSLLAILNSSLYHGLILSLSIERNWDAGIIGSLPWIENVYNTPELEDLAKEQYNLVVGLRASEPTSPYYHQPALIPSGNNISPYYNHIHIDKLPDWVEIEFDTGHISHPIQELSRNYVARERTFRQRLEEISDRIDDLIYSQVDISQHTSNDIRTEIFLRTSEDPEDREVPDPESVPEIPDNLEGHVKDLVHHFAMEAVREESDGIIPLEGTDEQADMLDRIVGRFEDAYGEYAEDRLVEVDDILGAESAADEAYPNLRSFIEDDLFAYHVNTMENTPIVWELGTARLLADAKGERFTCFVDYHQLDASLLDRLSNQYLDPRKDELRDRRSTANQRRNDDSLSASDQAEANEAYERYDSALEQIAEFESVLQDLGRTTERDIEPEQRAELEELATLVSAFRNETAERIDAIVQLREMNDTDWFQDTFSDGFWDKVDEWRDEWLDALDELERACDAYAKPADEPVEAHLADLFDYFDWRLQGSDHYSSNGILFMTYYFEREGEQFLDDDGEPFETLAEDEVLLASLARGLDDPSIFDEKYLQVVLEEYYDDEDDYPNIETVEDLPPLAEYKALAEEIDERCVSFHGSLSDWKDRARSEITTAGYDPNHKHGVGVNITPLAEAKIVPDIVEDKVL